MCGASVREDPAGGVRRRTAEEGDACWEGDGEPMSRELGWEKGGAGGGGMRFAKAGRKGAKGGRAGGIFPHGPTVVATAAAVAAAAVAAGSAAAAAASGGGWAAAAAAGAAHGGQTQSGGMGPSWATPTQWPWNQPRQAGHSIIHSPST